MIMNNTDEEDICGLCGEPGADKYAHPIHWSGERMPNGQLVHRKCEQEECQRAFDIKSQRERNNF
jgi:hypothetical protein